MKGTRVFYWQQGVRTAREAWDVHGIPQGGSKLPGIDHHEYRPGAASEELGKDDALEEGKPDTIGGEHRNLSSPRPDDIKKSEMWGTAIGLSHEEPPGERLQR